MKFEARSLGVFEILTPKQGQHEVFDADRFRQVVNALLERKVRQLVVDLSGIDYLYSDAINALVSINRRILEQAGKMSLLAPQPKVHEILMRSGLDSLFRIYKSESELSAESMELLRQSSLITRGESTSTTSSGYQASLKTPAPVPEGPKARQTRRRSGPRKEVPPRRATGRNSVPPPDLHDEDTPYAEPNLAPPGPSSAASSIGSSFPSAFAWDDGPAPRVQPPAQGFEIQHGISLPEESQLPAVQPPPPAFFPPPQALDEDMPTLEFRIPPREE